MCLVSTLVVDVWHHCTKSKAIMFNLEVFLNIWGFFYNPDNFAHIRVHWHSALWPLRLLPSPHACQATNQLQPCFLPICLINLQRAVCFEKIAKASPSSVVFSAHIFELNAIESLSSSIDHRLSMVICMPSFAGHALSFICELQLVLPAPLVSGLVRLKLHFTANLIWVVIRIWYKLWCPWGYNIECLQSRHRVRSRPTFGSCVEIQLFWMAWAWSIQGWHLELEMDIPFLFHFALLTPHWWVLAWKQNIAQWELAFASLLTWPGGFHLLLLAGKIVRSSTASW